MVYSHTWFNTYQWSFHLKDTCTCSRCGQPDYLQHRITDCEGGPVIWNWTRAKLGLILRMDPRQIPRTWTLRPGIHYWSSQRQAALLWIVAHLVYYRLQTHRRLSPFVTSWIFLNGLGGKHIIGRERDRTQADIWRCSKDLNFRAPLEGTPVFTGVCSRLYRPLLPSTTDKNPLPRVINNRWQPPVHELRLIKCS